MPSRTSTTSILSTLPTSIPKIFNQVQVSTANHQKNFVALHKLQSEAAAQTAPVGPDGRSVKLVGERAFEDVIFDMISRILVLKKGVTVADRIFKFIGGYIRFINEKVAEEKKKGNIDDEEDDTTASRFVSRVLKFLLKGFVAKDKTVRYRVVQLVAEMVSHLGELDEDVYSVLRSSLLDRVRDKEPPIRIQAVIGLSKLCGSEDPDDVEDGGQTVVEVLLEALAYDPSAEVRRATLLNISITSQTLPDLLTRTRDTDALTRRLVYSAVLEAHCHASETSELGVADPRTLKIAQREQIVRNGLGDREPAVRAAAAKLVGAWVEVVSDGVKVEDGGSKSEGLVRFLKLFDLLESEVAEDALMSAFTTRVDLVDNLEFDDAFWTDLNPERAFLARVFVDHCINNKDEARLESTLPVVTALAFRIQAAYNDLMEHLQNEEEERFLQGELDVDVQEERIEQRLDKEFVIGEMLRLAVNLDYADEIGRRKMFQLVRDMVSRDALPESLVNKCLDVLRVLSPNERDLIRLVVEVIHELRDPDSEEITARETTADETETNFGETPVTVKTIRTAPKPATEMTPEQKARADEIDLRCLSLCIGMLERVNGTFEENSTLEGILGELIVPAVKRKELDLREKGLISLGLCCLIARRMALNSFQLFLGQVQAAPEVLKTRVLQVVFDILMVHDRDILGNQSVAGDKIIEFLLHVWDTEESDKVQALLCIGISKLMLSGMVSDDRVLKSLVLAYISPDTAGNQELRQCLSYFFPVYCYSSPTNQSRLQQVFLSIYEQVSQAYKDLDEDQDMVSPAQVGTMFVDWTDPQKAVNVQGSAPDEMIHFNLANDIVKALLALHLPKDDKKGLCQMLPKLYIPDTVDDDKIRTLKLLLHHLQNRLPLKDVGAANAVAKFDSTISKKFEKQLEGFDEEEYRKLEELKELFEFLDDIIPEGEDEEEEGPKRKSNRKRRSESIATTSASESESVVLLSDDSSKRKRRGKAKRPRMSTSDESDDGTVQALSPPPEETPRRVMPRRSAAAKAKPIYEVPEESEEDDEEEVEEVTPEPPKRTKGKAARRSLEEEQLDAEIDDILDGAPPSDSIMDSDSEEEVEVDDMLAD